MVRFSDEVMCAIYRVAQLGLGNGKGEGAAWLMRWRAWEKKGGMLAMVCRVVNRFEMNWKASECVGDRTSLARNLMM